MPGNMRGQLVISGHIPLMEIRLSLLEAEVQLLRRMRRQ